MSRVILDYIPSKFISFNYVLFQLSKLNSTCLFQYQFAILFWLIWFYIIIFYREMHGRENGNHGRFLLYGAFNTFPTGKNTITIRCLHEEEKFSRNPGSSLSVIGGDFAWTFDLPLSSWLHTVQILLELNMLSFHVIFMKTSWSTTH